MGDAARRDGVPERIARMRDAGALFVINHSAGKDSQAMTIRLKEIVPPEQLLVIHADLGEVEWPGNLDHIRATVGNVPIEVCRNERKTFLQMVEQRGMWPSPQQRNCTSDLKRGPIEWTIRRHLKNHPHFEGWTVSCIGIRAEESTVRSCQQPLRRHAVQSIAGREWWNWLPIFGWTEGEVFEAIHAAGQRPHWAYDAGMTRLSCSFCIMASACDLRTAAGLRPDLYARYVETERRIGHTMSMSGRGLETITGIAANPAFTSGKKRGGTVRRMAGEGRVVKRDGATGCTGVSPPTDRKRMKVDG